jgi:hypothetical protein
MNRRSAYFVLAVAVTIATAARSGHELPVYPSYYPHEIQIETKAPEQAAALLRDNKLHAHVGSELKLSEEPPENIRAIESLGSFVLVRVNPASPLAKDEASACAVGRTVRRAIAARGSELIAYSYPVTPFHGDFLQYVDLAEGAKAKVFEGPSPMFTMNLKVKASDDLSKGLIPSAWTAEGPEWDADVESVSVSDLAAPERTAMNGWLGPPWARAGWFHAYLLLRDSLDEASKGRVEDQVHRLQSGDFKSAVERINFERDLVTSLTAGCWTVVAGYTVKREYFNTEFSAGIENVGFDWLDGFNSPIFLRTVKLKDFPWNGWLALSIAGRPAAAWNPIAGFTDKFGRLMWSAVGDPALLPSPYDSEWMLNRISDVQSTHAKEGP